MSIYDIGDNIRISSIFTNTANTTGDPSTVLFFWRDPSGLTGVVQYLSGSSLVREKTGVYYIETSLGVAGTFRFRWESTGLYAGAEEGSLTIRHSRI
jgi:hypothetical protein